VPRSKNGWSCAPTPPIRLHGVVLSYGEHRDECPLKWGSIDFYTKLFFES